MNRADLRTLRDWYQNYASWRNLQSVGVSVLLDRDVFGWSVEGQHGFLQVRLGVVLVEIGC